PPTGGAQTGVEDLPGLVAIRDDGPEDAHRRGRPAPEVREVHAELVEVHRVALRETLVLGLPILAEETAVHPADDRAALLASLDEVLERVEGAVGTFRRAIGEARGRPPRRPRPPPPPAHHPA